LTTRFLADWAPSAISTAPDGTMAGPAPAPRSSLPQIDPPSLCEAGPCRHYHRLVSVLDAQDAIGAALTDATGVTPRVITRACYPSAGIEVELAETPILQCSHWYPRDRRHQIAARQSYLASPEGREFLAEAAAYEAALGLSDNNFSEENDK
jgi:hypothetical protein